jgi:hypothetical protein
MRTWNQATTRAVDGDLACVVCNYNLRMQPLAGRCPECGAPIRHTLEFPHLARSAPRWLVSLVDSVTVLLVALLLSLVCLFTHNGNRDTAFSICIGTAAWGTAWFAVWLLTRPEPGVRDFDAVAWAWTLRVFTTAGYAGLFLAVPLIESFRPYGMIVVLTLLAAFAPATCLYYNHLRRAAGRLPNARLSFQAGALQLLLTPVALLACIRLFVGHSVQTMTDLLLHAPLVGLGSVGDAWTFQQIFRNRLGVWDWLPLSTAPSLILLLWAVAVLVQFRIAFATAVREAGGRAPRLKASAEPKAPGEARAASGTKSAGEASEVSPES